LSGGLLLMATSAKALLKKIMSGDFSKRTAYQGEKYEALFRASH